MAEIALPHAPAEHATSTGLNSRKLLMWTFLGSECMFFGSLIATYMIYRTHYQPGPSPRQILQIPLTSYSALLLLMSSLTMVLALAAVQRDDRRGSLLWIGATALLGMHFLANQAYEFTHFVHEGLKLQTSLFSCSFYVLTGFHGTHVTVGVIWLWSLFTMAARGRLPKGRALDVEVAALYWHFVDVVWIAIFTLVYLIQ
jgi:cytochrome c oxidase subunit 3/cytochrome o ubiquinol oxidase subunit 3